MELIYQRVVHLMRILFLFLPMLFVLLCPQKKIRFQFVLEISRKTPSRPTRVSELLLYEDLSPASTRVPMVIPTLLHAQGLRLSPVPALKSKLSLLSVSLFPVRILLYSGGNRSLPHTWCSRLTTLDILQQRFELLPCHCSRPSRLDRLRHGHPDLLRSSRPRLLL
jgi:hypothetical protein